MSEDRPINKISEQVTRIADALENNLPQIVGGLFGLHPILEDKSENQQSLSVEEEVIQDFENVTIMMETEKAYLVVKNGYQMWVAKSNLQEEYEIGTQQDLLLTEKAEKWLPKKSWDKYVPAKRKKEATK
jgi:hypothetical protein